MSMARIFQQRKYMQISTQYYEFMMAFQHKLVMQIRMSLIVNWNMWIRMSLMKFLK
jgi:hypothetical protein